jgi:predicted Zn-dependent protease
MRAMLLLATVTALAQPPSANLEKEEALGQAMAAKFERSSKILDDAIVVEYLRKLANKLAPDPTLSLTVKVIENADAGAAAFPGGLLFIYSGLIAGVETEAELAGILAHEIAHSAARHGTRQGESVFFSASSGICSRFGGQNQTPVGWQAIQRGFEYEADALGIEYAARAGYDPGGLVDFFERLDPGRNDLAGAKAKLKEQASTGRDYIVTSSEFQKVQERIQAMQPARHPQVPPSLEPKN